MITSGSEQAFYLPSVVMTSLSPPISYFSFLCPLAKPWKKQMYQHQSWIILILERNRAGVLEIQ